MVIEKINDPKDLRVLTLEEMNALASEMRECIIKKVNCIGGHMGPNLGIVEATIALHYVFNSPQDKFVFDVSHQCYPHKILTGRKEGFTNEEKYFDITGYTAPEESPHDLFKVGHTSTSVSLATGLAKARDLRGGNENIIALIGDGSLSGGEAFEGLNNASALNSNIIIIVNDNDMSIAENHGGLYNNLKQLRETNGTCTCNYFKAFGFDYHYLEEGNNISKLIELFQKVKDCKVPTVLHIHTQKGLGLECAMEQREAFHWILPHTLDKQETKEPQPETYTSATVKYLLNKTKEDKTVMVISAATPGATGFTPQVRAEFGNQYTDVGIAEEHAIAYGSGLAKNGAKPVFCVLSSFIQRTYDQVSQDLCLNKTPMTILVNWAGISSADATHAGMYDIPLLSNIPNLVYLAPTNKEEYLAMLDWSIEQNENPVAIRVPADPLMSTEIKDVTDYSKLNKYKKDIQGEKVAIIG